jgi:hypothetical protein
MESGVWMVRTERPPTHRPRGCAMNRSVGPRLAAGYVALAPRRWRSISPRPDRDRSPVEPSWRPRAHGFALSPPATTRDSSLRRPRAVAGIPLTPVTDRVCCPSAPRPSAQHRPGAKLHMPACTTCGGTDDVHLYERHDPRYEPRTWWWCRDCSYFAVRLNGIAADPVAGRAEWAALHALPPKPVEDPRDRRVSAGRRATDRRHGVEA